MSICFLITFNNLLLAAIDNGRSLTAEFDELISHLKEPEIFQERMLDLIVICKKRSCEATCEPAYTRLLENLMRTLQMYNKLCETSLDNAKSLAHFWLEQDKNFAKTIFWEE